MSIVSTAKSYVENLFKDKLSSIYLYHNFLHTVITLNRATEIINHTSISEENKEKVLLALCFHDTGFINGQDNHEEKSVDIFKEFMADKSYPQTYIDEVSTLILATEKYHQPTNLLEEIIRDADCSHFGSLDFTEISERLREEWSLSAFQNFSQEEWNKINLDVLKNKHRFLTEYAQKEWNPIKEKNIKKLEKKIEKKEEKNDDSKESKKESNDISKKDVKSDRSVDTLFRVTLNNHTRLSDIADSKANILLSVNAIIISVCLSVLIPKLDSPKNAHLIIPTFLMIISSVLTIIFAILSTKPKVTESKFSNDDVKNRKVNLLFFGNFQKMSLQEYQDAMDDMILDRDYIHRALVKDLYFLGKVLDRKYKLLSITYKIFMAGIIISVLAFGYALLSL